MFYYDISRLCKYMLDVRRLYLPYTSSFIHCNTQGKYEGSEMLCHLCNTLLCDRIATYL